MRGAANKLQRKETLQEVWKRNPAIVEPWGRVRKQVASARHFERWRWFAAAAIVIVLEGACLVPTHAGNTTFVDWTGDIGPWGNESNWQGDKLPQAFLGEGARIANGGTAVVATQVPSIECLSVDVGRVVVQNDLTLQVDQQAEVHALGVLTLQAGILDSPFTKLSGGALEGFGSIGGDLINDGRVRVGLLNNPIGTLVVEGDFQQGTQGSLFMQVASSQQGEFDQLLISGTAKLGGKLEIEIAPGALIPKGEAIQLITAGLIEDGFESVAFISSSTSLCFGWTCDESGALSIDAFDIGDMNLDGIIDAGDTPLFALALVDEEAYQTEICNATGLWIEPACIGNVDRMNAFDFDDIAAFASLAGLSVAAVTAEIRALQSVVPEPSALVMGLFAAPWALQRRGDALRTKPAARKG